MVNIQVEDETARRLEDLARARNQTVPGYLKTLADRSRPERSPADLSFEEWSKLWHEWITSHKPLDYVADDSRESIYEGRGE